LGIRQRHALLQVEPTARRFPAEQKAGAHRVVRQRQVQRLAGALGQFEHLRAQHSRPVELPLGTALVGLQGHRLENAG
jgi:hypothetical protein